jgi:hypothetical protein
MTQGRAARVFAAGLLFVLCSPFASAADVPLQVTVGETIAVSNATPGGNVVLFASGLDGSRGVLRQRRLAQAVVANGAGAIAYQPRVAFPYRTIFVAVDVETGRIAIAGPPDYEVQVRPFPTERLDRETDGVSGISDADIARADLLVIRPKGGAWRLSAAEGASGDVDKQHDGKLALDFSTATAVIPGIAAPSRLKNKDVVVLIDSAQLEIFTTEIVQ